VSREAVAPADEPGRLLMRALERRRAETGTSANGFAALLGISRSYYSLLRRGKRRPGPRLRRRILERYPDLRAFAVDPAPGDPRAEVVAVLDSWLGDLQARLARMEARQVRMDERQARIEATLEALRGRARPAAGHAAARDVQRRVAARTGEG
jgi:transcriptional regulator with XRE-family HTH domain